MMMGVIDMEVDRVADMVAEMENPEFLENAKISELDGLSHLDRRPVCKRREDLTNLKVKRRS